MSDEGVGSVLGLDAWEPVAVLWGVEEGSEGGCKPCLVDPFNRRMAPL